MSFQNTIKTGPGNFPADRGWYPDSLTFSNEGFPQVETIKDSIQGTFLQPTTIGSSPMEIAPLIKAASPYEWMTNFLLLLVVFMVVLWFIMPNQRSLFQQVKQFFKSPNEIASPTAGFLFSFFFYLNYLIIVVLFFILAFEQFIQSDSLVFSVTNLIVLISLVFVAYSMYKLIFIVLAGYLFKTRSLAMQQIRLYINIDIISGFLLVPILLLILSTQFSYFFYFGVFIILITNAIKWFRTIAIGKSTSMFKLYHLIIYLCTLEIIPVLLLLKLIGNLYS